MLNFRKIKSSTHNSVLLIFRHEKIAKRTKSEGHKEEITFPCRAFPKRRFGLQEKFEHHFIKIKKILRKILFKSLEGGFSSLLQNIACTLIRDLVKGPEDRHEKNQVSYKWSHIPVSILSWTKALKIRPIFFSTENLHKKTRLSRKYEWNSTIVYQS